jgi:hypothetical protein
MRHFSTRSGAEKFHPLDGFTTKRGTDCFSNPCCGNGAHIDLTVISMSTFSCACSTRPKGEQRTAQGFSPGKDTHNEIALKGRPRGERAWQQSIFLTLMHGCGRIRTPPDSRARRVKRSQQVLQRTSRRSVFGRSRCLRLKGASNYLFPCSHGSDSRLLTT